METFHIENFTDLCTFFTEMIRDHHSQSLINQLLHLFLLSFNIKLISASRYACVITYSSATKAAVLCFDVISHFNEQYSHYTLNAHYTLFFISSLVSYRSVFSFVLILLLMIKRTVVCNSLTYLTNGLIDMCLYTLKVLKLNTNHFGISSN